MSVHQNWIGSRWVSARSGATQERRNPADRTRVVAVSPSSEAQDAAVAVASARRAFPGWRDRSPAWRLERLHRAASHLAAAGDAIVDAIVLETGRPAAWARSEVHAAVTGLRALAIPAEGRTVSRPGSGIAVVLPSPRGVTGVLTPVEEPLARVVLGSAAALARGETVVVKPSPWAPGPAVAWARALEEADLPDGVLNLVLGSGRKVGAGLARHPDVNRVEYRGGPRGARDVLRATADRLGSVSIGVGGSPAAVVLEDADLDRAVEVIGCGAFRDPGLGALRRVVVDRRVLDPFRSRLEAALLALHPGPGHDPASDLGPLPTGDRRDQLEAGIRTAREGGAQVLGGERPRSADRERGWFLDPALVAGAGARGLDGLSGPVLGLVPVDSFEESLACVAEFEVVPRVLLFTRDDGRGLRAVRDLPVDEVWLDPRSWPGPVSGIAGGAGPPGSGFHAGSGLDTPPAGKALYLAGDLPGETASGDGSHPPS